MLHMLWVSKKVCLVSPNLIRIYILLLQFIWDKHSRIYNRPVDKIKLCQMTVPVAQPGITEICKKSCVCGQSGETLYKQTLSPIIESCCLVRKKMPILQNTLGRKENLLGPVLKITWHEHCSHSFLWSGAGLCNLPDMMEDSMPF